MTPQVSTPLTSAAVEALGPKVGLGPARKRRYLGTPYLPLAHDGLCTEYGSCMTSHPHARLLSSDQQPRYQTKHPLQTTTTHPRETSYQTRSKLRSMGPIFCFVRVAHFLVISSFLLPFSSKSFKLHPQWVSTATFVSAGMG